MQFKSLFFSGLALAAGGAYADRCGIAEPTQQHLNMSMQFRNNEDLTRQPGLAPRTNIPAIKVHIHVVATGDSESEGHISVSAQISVVQIILLTTLLARHGQ